MARESLFFETLNGGREKEGWASSRMPRGKHIDAIPETRYRTSFAFEIPSRNEARVTGIVRIFPRCVCNRDRDCTKSPRHNSFGLGITVLGAIISNLSYWSPPMTLAGVHEEPPDPGRRKWRLTMSSLAPFRRAASAPKWNSVRLPVLLPHSSALANALFRCHRSRF